MHANINVKNCEEMKQHEIDQIDILTISNIDNKFQIDFLLKGKRQVEGLEVCEDHGYKSVTFERSRCYRWIYNNQKNYPIPLIYGDKKNAVVSRIYQTVFNTKPKGCFFKHTHCFDQQCVNPLHIKFFPPNEARFLDVLWNIGNLVVKNDADFCFEHNEIIPKRGVRFDGSYSQFAKDNRVEVRKHIIERGLLVTTKCLCTDYHDVVLE